MEPNPEYLPGLLANRKCMIFTNPVSTAMGDEVSFVFGGVYGGMVGKEFDNKEAEQSRRHNLTTVTMNSILEFAKAPAVMDYLSLDVEGAEYHALQNFDFSKYTFHVVTVERPSSKVHEILTKNGYRFCRQLISWGDCLYLHHTFPAFTETMNTLYNGQVGDWDTGIPRKYMLHPAWDGTYREFHHHQHHNATLRVRHRY